MYRSNAVVEVKQPSHRPLEDGPTVVKAVSVQVTYAIVCDQCGTKMLASRKSPGMQPSSAYNEVRRKTIKAKWVERNMGSKGNRHYCFGCTSSEPQLAAWHMQKILTKT